jgi:hypothetical protein
MSGVELGLLLLGATIIVFLLLLRLSLHSSASAQNVRLPSYRHRLLAVMGLTVAAVAGVFIVLAYLH